MPTPRTRSARRAAAALLALALAACRTAHPDGDGPWEHLERGRLGVALRPGVFTSYGIEGDFEADTPGKGPVEIEDDGELVGRYGAALSVELAVSRWATLSAGVDARSFDVEDLNPIEELDVEVERIDSYQVFLAARGWLPPLARWPRLRPFAQAGVAYLPEVDVEFEVDLSDFGASNLVIESEGEGYWIGSAAGGLAWSLRPGLVLEAGLAYEWALTPLEADLSFEIAGEEVPFKAELRPEGWIGFLGVTWWP